MSKFFDPTGRSTYGQGICDRCRKPFSLEDLFPDPNTPGLRVCLDDLDDLDPWRLPARRSENISLPFVRPDVQVQNGPAVFTLTQPFLATESWDYITTEDGDLIVCDGVE